MHSSTLTNRSLRVVVVEDDDVIRQSLVQALERSLGHQVVGQAATGLEMVEVVLETTPDVVVFDVHLPQRNGLDALREIFEQYQLAAVAITADRDPDLVKKASHEQVLAYLIKPVEPLQLGPAITIALARFEQINQLASENARLQKSLENRKLIERAKGVLMRRHRWTEAEAFRRLQRGAMDRRTTMAELARQILDGKEVEL